jgi:hypothetical protein
MPDETPQPQAQQPDPPPAQPPASDDTPTVAASSGDAWLGAVVWAIVAVVVTGYFWFNGRADVVLNVSGTDPIVVDGRVTSDGATPVGTVHVLVEDPRGEKLLASATGDLDANGAFRVEFNASQLTGVRTDGLLVTGDYKGRTSKDDKGKGITGHAIVYVNMTPPWRLGWGAAILVGVLVTLAILFTGPLSPRKARLLFALTYLVTFSACVIPILLTILVSQSPYMLVTMQSAPIGILKAKAKGLEQPQWLLNIGGFVTVAPIVTTTPPVAAPATPPLAPPKTQDAAAGDTTPQAAAASAGDAPKLPVDAPAKPNDSTASGASGPPTLQVLGGLAIPLYVLVLAMFGAGINMTRKVPEIQNSFDSNAPATLMGALTAPADIFNFMRKGPAGAKADQSGIRQTLIETYMYFLSAPFLAVAVYYLLQVIATSVAEPVLVVIAFATGLMSNTAIGAIMAFADTQLAKAKSPSNPPTPPAKTP